MLALLLGVANGDTFERIDAVHAVLAWRSRKGQVTEGAIALYIASLKVQCVLYALVRTDATFVVIHAGLKHARMPTMCGPTPRSSITQRSHYCCRLPQQGTRQ